MDDPLLVDYVSCRYRQSVFRFIVEPIESAPKRLVKIAQVIRQRENQPKLLRGLQMKIRQDVERQVQFLVQSARIPFK